MSYYHNKEKFDPQNAGNRKEGSPKDINDPFWGTGSSSKNTPPGEETRTDDPVNMVHKDYNAASNSAGPHSSTEKPEV